MRPVPTIPLAVLLVAATPALAAPRVVVDIAPAHAIVSRVMLGVAEPALLVSPGASPHGHAMRPSEARALEAADLVLWVGPTLTPWLAEPIDALAPGAVQVRFLDAPDLTMLPARPSGGFEPPDHAHDHAAATEDDHYNGGDGDRAAADPHVWLDPSNAAVMAAVAADALARLDPDHATIYRGNAAAFSAEIATLDTEIRSEVTAVSGRPYVVFHDAYQYFEHRFHLPATGAIAIGDADRPSAARVRAIRDRIREAGVVCVFSEPQFEPALVETVIEGTDARTGILDPIGSELPPGPDLYPRLLRAFSANFVACLADPDETDTGEPVAGE